MCTIMGMAGTWMTENNSIVEVNRFLPNLNPRFFDATSTTLGINSAMNYDGCRICTYELFVA